MVVSEKEIKELHNYCANGQHLSQDDSLRVLDSHATLQRTAEALRKALEEAVDLIDNLILYKSAYLVEKHHDTEDFENIKAVLAQHTPPSPASAEKEP